MQSRYSCINLARGRNWVCSIIPQILLPIDPLLNILIVFVEEGVGYCVQTITKGNTFYTSVLNPGDVTGVGHHRFTCLVRHVCIWNTLFYRVFFQIESIGSKTLFFLLQAISLSGSQIQISDSAGSCEAGQTATVKASDGSGLLTLTSTGE